MSDAAAAQGGAADDNGARGRARSETVTGAKVGLHVGQVKHWRPITRKLLRAKHVKCSSRARVCAGNEICGACSNIGRASWLLHLLDD